MGFTELLTIIFVVLKIIGVIHWNWFLVLLPEIVAFLFYGITAVLVVIGGAQLIKRR